MKRYLSFYDACHTGDIVLYCQQGKTMKPGGLPLQYSWRVLNSPPDERKEGDRMNVTYSDLFQFCIFVVALVGLCHQIFKGKK